MALALLEPCTAAAERVAPQWLPPGERLCVLIDTDAACETDDLYTIALALAAPDRFKIEGFIAAHFGDAGGPDGISKSVAAINTVLEKAELVGRFPVKCGVPPFQYSAVPVESEGVEFIVQRAPAVDEQLPLWIVSLGACANVVSAWLKRQEIARRVVVFWHRRTQFWPEKCWNFYAYNDLKALRILLRSDLPLMLFDTGTHLVSPLSESDQRLRPCGELGKYLHEFRLGNPALRSPKKGFFDLGDIAALMNPTLTKWEVVAAPDVNWDMLYRPGRGRGNILRAHDIDRDGTFELFHLRMSLTFPHPPKQSKRD